MIKFNNIKDSRLGLLDIITFGKYQGCRVDSLVDTPYGYEYLKYVKDQFQPSVIEKAELFYKGYLERKNYEEEIRPWQDAFEEFDDIPY